jgi:hypothetical protein
MEQILNHVDAEKTTENSVSLLSPLGDRSSSLLCNLVLTRTEGPEFCPGHTDMEQILNHVDAEKTKENSVSPCLYYPL